MAGEARAPTFRANGGGHRYNITECLGPDGSLSCGHQLCRRQRQILRKVNRERFRWQIGKSSGTDLVSWSARRLGVILTLYGARFTFRWRERGYVHERFNFVAGTSLCDYRAPHECPIGTTLPLCASITR
jgi:hypothetical protein